VSRWNTAVSHGTWVFRWNTSAPVYDEHSSCRPRVDLPARSTIPRRAVLRWVAVEVEAVIVDDDLVVDPRR
jgi:hypothetical protein